MHRSRLAGRSRVLLSLVVAMASIANVCSSQEARELVEHPRARAYVNELASSDDPRVQHWSWRHLEMMADGALPALQPLLSHKDPVRQWKALRIVRPYEQRAPDRIPSTLQFPEYLEFAPERLQEALFMIASETGHSLLVESGALDRVEVPLRVRVKPFAPWDDLMSWCEQPKRISHRDVRGILVLTKAAKQKQASEVEVETEATEALAPLPEEVYDSPVWSRAMHKVPPGRGMRVIQTISPGAGLVVLPGVWQETSTFSYLMMGAPWHAVVEAMSAVTGLETTWCGTTLVVSGAADVFPADLAEIDFAGMVRSPTKDGKPPPMLTTFDRLTDDPLGSLSEVTAAARLYSVIVPEVRAHIAELPHAKRPGQARGELRPWMHARFNAFTAEEALHVMAALLGLEAKISAGQAMFSIRPAAEPEPEER